MDSCLRRNDRSKGLPKPGNLFHLDRFREIKKAFRSRIKRCFLSELARDKLPQNNPGREQLTKEGNALIRDAQAC